MRENVSYFADKARLTQNKCRVNLFFLLFLKPVHGACQQQTRHKPGCMFDTMGLQVRAAQDATVQRNTNDICCTWKRGIILPLGIPHSDPCRHCFSSSRDTKRTAMPRQRGSRVFLPMDPVCFKKNLPLFSSEAAAAAATAALLGEFDGQLSVCQSIMWFLSHNRILGARLLISLLIQRDENTYSPIAYRHEFVTPRTSGGEMNIIKNEIHKKEKTIRPNGRKGHLKIYRGQSQKMAGALRSVAGLRARTVNWRRSIAIKR